MSHSKYGTATATWVNRDGEGRPLFGVRRFETPKGKVTLPLTYGELHDDTCWHWKRPALPLPLYGLDRLANAPDAPVLVVEGEKRPTPGPMSFPVWW